MKSLFKIALKKIFKKEWNKVATKKLDKEDPFTEIPWINCIKLSSDYFHKHPHYKIRLKIWSNLPKDIQVRDINF